MRPVPHRAHLRAQREVGEAVRRRIERHARIDARIACSAIRSGSRETALLAIGGLDMAAVLMTSPRDVARWRGRSERLRAMLARRCPLSHGVSFVAQADEAATHLRGLVELVDAGRALHAAETTDQRLDAEHALAQALEQFVAALRPGGGTHARST